MEPVARQEELRERARQDRLAFEALQVGSTTTLVTSEDNSSIGLADQLRATAHAKQTL